jgi:hypothetical protein
METHPKIDPGIAPQRSMKLYRAANGRLRISEKDKRHAVPSGKGNELICGLRPHEL